MTPHGLAGKSGDALKDELTRQQIISNALDNHDKASGWHLLVAELPILTVLVALATFALGWYRQNRDDTRQRQLDREQREELALQHANADIAAVVSNLASDNLRLATSSAALIPVYLGTRPFEYCEMVLAVVSAHLKLAPENILRGALVRVLSSTLRRASALHGIRQLNMDLTGAALAEIDLSGVDLRDANIQLEGADLVSSMLEGANLWKAHMNNVDMSRARLVHTNFGQAKLRGVRATDAAFDGAALTSADLRHADLRQATFRGAHMQSAHLDGADLRGARFEGANIADAYFLLSQIDDDGVDSLRKAINLTRAHFDPALRARLGLST